MVWRNRLARQATSGLTVAEFCRLEGVSSQLVPLEKEAGGQGAGSIGQRSLKTKSAIAKATGQEASQRPGGRGWLLSGSDPFGEGPGFVPVSLPASPSSPWIELILADGSVIRLRTEYFGAQSHGLSHSLSTLRRRVTQHHARLASGCRSALPGGSARWVPTKGFSS